MSSFSSRGPGWTKVTVKVVEGAAVHARDDGASCSSSPASSATTAIKENDEGGSAPSSTVTSSQAVADAAALTASLASKSNTLPPTSPAEASSKSTRTTSPLARSSPGSCQSAEESGRSGWVRTRAPSINFVNLHQKTKASFSSASTSASVSSATTTTATATTTTATAAAAATSISASSVCPSQLLSTSENTHEGITRRQRLIVGGLHRSLQHASRNLTHTAETLLRGKSSSSISTSPASSSAVATAQPDLIADERSPATPSTQPQSLHKPHQELQPSEQRDVSQDQQQELGSKRREDFQSTFHAKLPKPQTEQQQPIDNLPDTHPTSTLNLRLSLRSASSTSSETFSHPPSPDGFQTSTTSVPLLFTKPESSESESTDKLTLRVPDILLLALHPQEYHPYDHFLRDFLLLHEYFLETEEMIAELSSIVSSVLTNKRKSICFNVDKLQPLEESGARVLSLKDTVQGVVSLARSWCHFFPEDMATVQIEVIFALFMQPVATHSHTHARTHTHTNTHARREIWMCRWGVCDK